MGRETVTHKLGLGLDCVPPGRPASNIQSGTWRRSSKAIGVERTGAAGCARPFAARGGTSLAQVRCPERHWASSQAGSYFAMRAGRISVSHALAGASKPSRQVSAAGSASGPSIVFLPIPAAMQTRNAGSPAQRRARSRSAGAGPYNGWMRAEARRTCRLDRIIPRNDEPCDLRSAEQPFGRPPALRRYEPVAARTSCVSCLHGSRYRKKHDWRDRKRLPAALTCSKA